MVKRGRPAFKPTAKQRRSVEQMISVGESHNTIAHALGIDDDTLRKHFQKELTHGASKRRQEVLEILYKAARNGNVSAAKRIEEMTRLAMISSAVNGGEEPRAPVRAPKLGKKQEEQAAADAVTGKFEPPAPPKLVVNNQ